MEMKLSDEPAALFVVTLLFSAVAVSGIIMALFAWITYHCAYRRVGTAWLTFLLFTLPMNIVSRIIPIIYMIIFLFIPESIIAQSTSMPAGMPVPFLRDLKIVIGTMGLMSILMIGVNFWFWLCSLRFRTKNQLLWEKKEKTATCCEPAQTA